MYVTHSLYELSVYIHSVYQHDHPHNIQRAFSKQNKLFNIHLLNIKLNSAEDH